MTYTVAKQWQSGFDVFKPVMVEGNHAISIGTVSIGFRMTVQRTFPMVVQVVIGNSDTFCASFTVSLCLH